MRRILFAGVAVLALWAVMKASGQQEEKAPPVSEATQECLSCHEVTNPGIVEDWRRSRHARTTPGDALKKNELERRVSAKEVPEELAKHVVGCAECHMINRGKHEDSFEHGGYEIHTVVSPPDCAFCHPAEEEQYGGNIMAHAYGNLKNNPVFMDLANHVNGTQVFKEGKLEYEKPSDAAEAASCLACHGTDVKIKGKETRETDLGEMEFPLLSGWPNQGTGRLNPDGSMGCCTACHARHEFSIEVARKPYTCSQCHKGPDVPAYKVYEVSKHGNIFSSKGKEWNFDAVPWSPGRDYSTPTCASCHVSLLVNGEGDKIVERTHRMNDRLANRLLGAVYSVAHPKSPDTSKIRNKAGLPLPAELTGEPAQEYLIDLKERKKRDEAMKKVCYSCHGTDWVAGHFKGIEDAIKETNAMTLAATQLLGEAWKKGAAKGLEQKDSIFNEAIEKKWVEQWLFYCNSTRYAAAMAGADYGVFANGRWQMSRNLQEIADLLELKTKNLKDK